MKRAKSAARHSAAKSTAPKKAGAPKTVEGYLARVPESARSNFEKLREAVRSAVPSAADETISYGILAFRHDRVLVWLGAFSDHCSLFPTAAVIEEFEDELQGLSTSKGTIHFPNEKPVPVALVKKLVKARVAQNEGKRR
jgi:uncharacterized protein YdhG (YjbR/CyaY superfamily)